MTEIVLAEQTLVFIQAAALGVTLGLLYDMLRIFRIFLKAKTLLTGLFDLVFCGASIAALFLFIMEASKGIARYYIFLGAVLGMLLYFFSVSPLFVGLFMKIGKFLAAGVAFLLRPVKKLASFIRKRINFRKNPKKIKKPPLSFLKNIVIYKNRKEREQVEEHEQAQKT